MTTRDEQSTINHCAEHFATTAMMNVPVTMAPRVFIEAVTKRFQERCEELIVERLRRAGMKQP